MASRYQTLADGQLGASAAALFDASTVLPSITSRIDVVLCNTGEPPQTVVMTLQRAGGTARQIARSVLKKNWVLVLRGLGMQPNDTLLGVADGAAAVDYLVSTSNDTGFAIQVYEDDGAVHRGTVASVSVGQNVSLSQDGMMISGLLEEIRDILQRIGPG